VRQDKGWNSCDFCFYLGAADSAPNGPTTVATRLANTCSRCVWEELFSLSSLERVASQARHECICGQSYSLDIDQSSCEMSASKTILNKSLKSQLIDLIRLKGPLTVNQYMKIVLTNPYSGFYMNNDVFGVKGHFTTNPEISQVFGEILGAWIIHEWRRFGSPKPLRLVEFGPGRGTLMSDITRTIDKLEKVSNSIQLRLIEVSPKLRDVQKQTLSQYSDIEWHSHLEGVQDRETHPGFTAFIAHEYLDALPIHKFVRDRTTKKWRELLIDYDKNQDLRFCIARQPTLSARLLVPEDFQGDHFEACPEAALQLERVSKCLNATQKGCMLICDYGFEDLDDALAKSNRDTFRAFKDHDSWPPLRDPGEADLTADVDFGYLKNHLKDKTKVYGTVSQRDFLLKCGLQQRVNFLLERSTSEKEKEDLITSANLMINDMGQRYKFMSIFPKGTDHLFDNDPPAGFY
jgi:NADH dehydrogenase [ubiquinone] 1 alpha subcomplex assembly factor 7